MAAGTTGYTPQFVSRQEESMGNSLLYDLVNQMYAYAPEQESPKDAVFEAEKKTILELAQKGNCVLVGRCADWLLRKDPIACGSGSMRMRTPGSAGSWTSRA